MNEILLILRILRRSLIHLLKMWGLYILIIWLLCTLQLLPFVLISELLTVLDLAEGLFLFFFIPRPDCHSHPHTITRFQYDYSHKKFLIQNWATACSLLKEGLCWPSKTPWSFFVRSSPPPFSHTRRPMSGRNRIAQRLCMLFSFEPSW